MKKQKRRILNEKFKTEVEKVMKKFKEDLYALHDMATKDEKTGIYNNRFFNNIFELELERAKRKQQKLSLAIIDIDHFKKLNDTYGHLLGDKILYHLAQNMQETIRKYDTLARFGGEEFFILLPETNITQAKKVMTRIRKNMNKNKTLKKYNVTVSIGITEYKEKDNKKRMTNRADKALYEAKKNGRDQIQTR